MSVCTAVKSGASSTITCTFVPLNPNELIPARRGALNQPAMATPPSVLYRQPCPVDTRIARLEVQDLAGFPGAEEPSITLIKPAIPAAASRWPMLDLTDPIIERVVRIAAFRKNRAECADLDRITERRAGAMCFDITHNAQALFRYF